MARQETIFTVFVASPSDLDEERGRLEEAIREMNTIWARQLSIRLELVRWETHAYPSFGKDPQAVINDQIPDDYDLFIGIMWYRFGTPTGRAGSGTIEEFQRAKERFDRDSSALQLMIYFKDAPAPLPPSKLDYEQLSKVAKFRESLGKEGGLFWPFQSADDFEKLVRLHLARHIQSFQDKHQNNQQSSSYAVISKSDTENSLSISQDNDKDELGLLDLMEQFELEFDILREITDRIAAATAEIGKKMVERAEELNQFASGPDSKNRKIAKSLIAKAAIDMDQYVYRMETELPLFSQHLNIGMNALVDVSQLSVGITDILQVNENIEAVRKLQETLIVVESSMTGFQKTVANLPKMTVELNRARSSVVNVLQRLIDEFRSGYAMAHEAETSFSSLIDQTSA